MNYRGCELLHLPDRQGPLELDCPIPDQRRYWFANDAYNKAVLAMVPMTGRPGFHGRAAIHFNFDPDLRLIHLHRMNYDICLERHRTRGRRPWTERDAREGWAIHNQITEEAEFHRWFHQEGYIEGFEIKVEEMPSSWRGLF